MTENKGIFGGCGGYDSELLLFFLLIIMLFMPQGCCR